MPGIAMIKNDYDIIIVGGGTVGGVAAIFLKK